MRLIGPAVALTLGLTLSPLASEAQTVGKAPRVGVLSLQSGSDPEVQRALDVFRQALRELGHVEGQNLAIEYRFAEGRVEQLPELATALVRLKMDVIVTFGGGLPPAQAAQRATKAIPIIATGTADPVAAGLVASLARPGGNITGPAMISHEVVGKRLELLREIVPRASRVAILWNPSNPGNLPSCEGRSRRPRRWGCGFCPSRCALPARSTGPSRR